MRGKKAKQLRSMALKTTVGVPWKNYVRSERTKVITLHPGCGRWMYQQSKRLR